MEIIKVYENIVVSPIIDIHHSIRGMSNHCAGPIYPDFINAGFSRHHWGTQPVDTIPVVSDEAIVSEVSGEYIYGGCIYNHFGHFTAEFTSRLFPICNEYRDLKIIYSVREDFLSLPKFIADIFEYFEITNRVVFIKNFSKVEKLFVQKQMETLGYGEPATRSYLNIIEKFSIKLKSEKKKKYLYVSRAKQLGRFAAEKYIEDILKEFGFDIFYPEDVSLALQLRTYLEYENLVFSEGSALHGLQYLGVIDSTIYILSRRETFPDVFIKARVEKLFYIDCITSSFGACSADGALATYTDIVFLDFSLFIFNLQRYFGFDISSLLNKHSINTNYETMFFEDIKNYISVNKGYDLFKNKYSIARLIKGIIDVNLLTLSMKLELIECLLGVKLLHESNTLPNQYSLTDQCNSINFISKMDDDRYILSSFFIDQLQSDSISWDFPTIDATSIKDFLISIFRSEMKLEEISDTDFITNYTYIKNVLYLHYKQKLIPNFNYNPDPFHFDINFNQENIRVRFVRNCVLCVNFQISPEFGSHYHNLLSLFESGRNNLPFYSVESRRSISLLADSVWTKWPTFEIFRELSNLLKLSGLSSLLLVSLARFYFFAKKYDLAALYAIAAVSYRPDSGSWPILATSLEKTLNFPVSHKYWTKLCQLYPNKTEYTDGLNRVSSQLGYENKNINQF